MSEIPARTEVHLIRAGEDSDRTAQSAGVARATAPPGMRSAPHHHGEVETGVYVLSGRRRFYFGDGFKEYVDAGPVDLVFVPANTPHIEENLSQDEPAELVGVRSPRNIVVSSE